MTTTNISEQRDAEKLADATMIFPYAGQMSFTSGTDKAEELLQKFYPNYKVDKELSQARQQVYVNPKSKDIVINFNGTQNPLDAYQTWTDVMSKEQSKITKTATAIATTLDPEITGTIAGVKESFSEMVVPIIKFFDVPDFNQRLVRGQKLIDDAGKKYTGFNKMLTGYSLGGAVAKELANKNKLNALLFNSAIGKTKVSSDEKNKIIEFRINNDLVSKRFIEPVDNQIFTIKKKKPTPYGMFQSIEKLVVDTDRQKEPIDPLQAHWLENFIIDKNKFYDTINKNVPFSKQSFDKKQIVKVKPKEKKEIKITGNTKFQNMVKGKSENITTKVTDQQLSNIIKCAPCPKGALICKCKKIN